MQNDKRETFNKHNTLNCIPMMLMNRNIWIDLRNECSVAGKIIDADGYMNITMENVIYKDQKGTYYQMENFQMPSRTIRYIHIPEDIKLKPDLQIFLDKIGPKKLKKPDKKTFKQSRAMRQHKETLKEIYKHDQPGTSNS